MRVTEVRGVLGVLGILRLWKEVIELVCFPVDPARGRVGVGDRLVDRLSADPARILVALALSPELCPEFLKPA